MSTIALAFAGLVDHYVAMNNFKSDKKQLSKAADLCLQLYRASFLLTPKDKALKTTIYNMFSSLLTEICQIYEEEDPKDPFFGEENIATSMNNIAKGKDSDKERKKTEKDIKEIEKVKDTKKEDKETEKEVKEDEKERKTNEQIIDTKKEVKDTELAKDIKKNTKETPRRTELAKDTKKEVKETEKERKTHQTKDTKKDIRPPTIYNVALLLKCILDKVKPNIDTEIYEEFIDTVLLELVYYLISFFKTYLAFDISTAPISDDFSYIKPENAIHFLFSLSIHRSPDRFLKYDSYNTLSSDIYKILRSASNKVMNSRNYKQTMKEFEEVKKKIAELSQSSDKKFNDQDQKFNDYDQKLLEMKKLIEEQAKQLKQYKLNEEVTNKSLSEEKSEHANEILALQKQIENLTLANKELQNDLESTKENRDKINTEFQNLYHRLLKRDSEYNQLKKDMKDLEAAKNKKIKEQASLIQAEKARVKEYQEKMGKHYSNSTTFNGIDDFNNKFEFIYSYVLEKRAEDYSLDFNEIKDN